MHTRTSAPAEQQRADLAEQLTPWRQLRTYRFAPFSHPLWEQAIAFTAVFPRAAVAKGVQRRGRALPKHCAARSASPEWPPRLHLGTGWQSPPLLPGPCLGSRPRARCTVPLAPTCGSAPRSPSNPSPPWSRPVWRGPDAPAHPPSRIFLATEPMACRKGLAGLAAVYRLELRAQPLSGAILVCRHRAATREHGDAGEKRRPPVEWPASGTDHATPQEPSQARHTSARPGQR
jgi:hypothetical protein